MLDQTRAQLKHQGFVQTTLSDPFKKIFAIAASAFQAQLAVFDKQPAQNRRAGFKRSARRQRLEVRQGNDSLGQLGISQHVAVDVMQAFDDLARGLIMSLAASLHLPADAFQPILDNAELYCKQSASTLEAIHDMLPESQAVQLNTPEACREHKDKGTRAEWNLDPPAATRRSDCCSSRLHP